MHLRTFHAPSIQDAIRQARQELGSDAMLLNSRRLTPADDASSVFAVTFATAAPPAPALSGKTNERGESAAGRADTNAKEERNDRGSTEPKSVATYARTPRQPGLDRQTVLSCTVPDPVLGAPPLPVHRSGAGSEGYAADGDLREAGNRSEAEGHQRIGTLLGEENRASKDNRAARPEQAGKPERPSRPGKGESEFRTEDKVGVDARAGIGDRGVAALPSGWVEAPLPSYEKLFEQMTSMRREMLQLAGSVRRASAAGYRQDLPNEELRWAYDVLVSQEFYPEAIEEVIDQISANLAPVVPAEPSDRPRKRRGTRSEERSHGTGVLPLLRDALASRIELAPEPGFRRRNSSPHLVAVVGPPGVGKTTTLVKLAARYGMSSRFPLQIISMDNYRVAASEQLRTYASVLGVGFDALPSAASLEKTLRQYESKELILIDTPGYGWRDFPAAEDLAAVLRQAQSATIHLVVSASMKPSDLARVADLYEVFGYGAILFTKIDETATIGPLVSESGLRRKPLSYLCAGQRIPEDLEVASRERILDRLLPSSLSSDECAA